MVERTHRPGRHELWHGWTVCTSAGDEVGAVVGGFRCGPHQGHLRVHGPAAGGTAVFAIPPEAVTPAGNATLVLTATASEAFDWLAYVVRRYGGR
jgi:hypothetical protein